MQQPVRAESQDCGYESPVSSRSRRTKAMVAGAALVSAGALALTPVMVTPTLPDVQVNQLELARSDAYAMTALDSAFGPYGALVRNLYGEIVTGRDVDVRVDHRVRGADGEWNMAEDDPDRYTWEEQFQESLINNVSNSSNNLVQTLTNPTVHAGFADAIQNLADPERLLGVLGNLPEYAERLTASSDLGGDFLQNALTTLLIGNDEQDGALPRTLALLSEGKFFAAFSEINYWFLVDGLSAGRQSQIDGGVLSLPGDILLDLGLVPLANIIGHSSMEDYGLSANDGLLGRSVIGNLGRALMAPPITAIFQTMEILDDVQKFVRAEDYDLAVAELVAAPAKITSAFLTGYVPGPLKDFSMDAGRGQAFPGIFSPTGPLDFFFKQVPDEIAKGLAAEKLPPATDDDESVDSASESVATLASVTDTNVSRKAVTVDVEVPAAVDVEVPAAVEDATEDTDSVTDALPEEDAITDDSTKDEAKALTTRDRIKEVREQASEQRKERAEQRAERAEKTRATVDRVRSDIRKGLGLPDRSKSSAGSQDSGDATSSNGSGGGSDSDSGSTSKSGSGSGSGGGSSSGSDD